VTRDAVIETVQLGMPWPALDPFIFTVHHVDHYPAGNAALGPERSLLSGRNIGADFSYRDGWSMYHGDQVPGFPQHPHRGFETVTVVRRGYVDHSDSLGATARYGEGDVQWLTTGGGIMHAEMFPLLSTDGPNHLELFQIWLNLPPESKMVDAYFGMLWEEDIPKVEPADGVRVEVFSGPWDGIAAPPSPPPDSWASRPGSHLGIWHMSLEPGAEWVLPTAPGSVNRMLHGVGGGDVDVAGTTVRPKIGVRLRADAETRIVNADEPAQMMLLQGEPIGAPVFQMGPFVMNTPEELRQAVDDYRRTQFGGWPWSGPSPVHAREEGRFALHADGEVEHRERHPSGT
jgi:quercetin 2,3-dioxygenase